MPKKRMDKRKRTEEDPKKDTESQKIKRKEEGNSREVERESR